MLLQSLLGTYLEKNITQKIHAPQSSQQCYSQQPRRGTTGTSTVDEKGVACVYGRRPLNQAKEGAMISNHIDALERAMLSEGGGRGERQRRCNTIYLWNLKKSADELI